MNVDKLIYPLNYISVKSNTRYSSTDIPYSAGILESVSAWVWDAEVGVRDDDI